MFLAATVNTACFNNVISEIAATRTCVPPSAAPMRATLMRHFVNEFLLVWRFWLFILIFSCEHLSFIDHSKFILIHTDPWYRLIFSIFRCSPNGSLYQWWGQNGRSIWNYSSHTHRWKATARVPGEGTIQNWSEYGLFIHKFSDLLLEFTMLKINFKSAVTITLQLSTIYIKKSINNSPFRNR